MNVNGLQSAGRTGTTNFTAYISPYLVVSYGGNYTKHIYMGGQRITSKVSNSEIFTTSPVTTTDLQAKYTAQTAKIKERFDSLGVVYKGNAQSGGLITKNPTPEGKVGASYYYHSDHLGSSSLITDQSGAIVQHLEYVPFGETFIDERKSQSSWTTPYLFSGKERDEETGLLYFGARYQDSKYGIWYSVDPLAENKPWLSSYVYCRDNPINMIDPDGRDEKQRQAALSKAKDYVKKNPGNSYGKGAGQPGQKVDCSGLVSNCVIAGGETNPNHGNELSGVNNIINNTQKVDNAKEVQEGNLIAFTKGGHHHIGIITRIIKDENGKVIGYDFIDSGGKPSRGYSGPRSNQTAMLDGSGSWGGILTGVYKWDTKPDVVNSGAPNDVFTKITGIQQGKPKFSLGGWIMDHTKIGTGSHEVGRLIQKTGL